MCFPMLMLATFWVPDSFMPSWIRTIATYNPLSQLIDVSRGLMLGGASSSDHLIAWSVIAAGILVTQVAVTRNFATLLDE